MQISQGIVLKVRDQAQFTKTHSWPSHDFSLQSLRSRIGHGSEVRVAKRRSSAFQPPQHLNVSGSRASEVNFATSRLSLRFQAHEFFKPLVSQQGEKTPGDGEWDVWSGLEMLLSMVVVGFGVFDGK